MACSSPGSRRHRPRLAGHAAGSGPGPPAWLVGPGRISRNGTRPAGTRHRLRAGKRGRGREGGRAEHDLEPPRVLVRFRRLRRKCRRVQRPDAHRPLITPCTPPATPSTSADDCLMPARVACPACGRPVTLPRIAHECAGAGQARRRRPARGCSWPRI